MPFSSKHPARVPLTQALGPVRTFSAIFGCLLGLIIALHGAALAALHSPLIATSNRKGEFLYFQSVADLTSEGFAWLLSGTIWFSLGLAIVYASIDLYRVSRPGYRPKHEKIRKKHRTGHRSQRP